MAGKDSNTTSSSLTPRDVSIALGGEPRIEDLRLAQALEMERPHEFRRLIARHRTELERLGEVCVTVTQTSARGGRPGRTFWLNKRQALYLCTKSETPRATETTIAMVEVFDAHLARSLPAPDPNLAGLNHVLEHQMPAGDFAFMRIGRRTVMLDTRRFRPGPDDEAVVIREDGRIVITKVRDCDVPNWFGVRCAAEQWRRPRKNDPRGARTVSDYVQVLGVVIRPALPVVTGGRPKAGRPAPLAPAPRAPRRRASAALGAGVPLRCRPDPAALRELPVLGSA